MIASAMGKPLEVGVGGGVGDGRTVSVEVQITHSLKSQMLLSSCVIKLIAFIEACYEDDST